MLSRATLPIFVMFFMWGWGTGALWVVRPLTAASFGVSVFLVGVVSATAAFPRIFSGPIAGILADRWGRRPLIIAGSVIHGLTLMGQFFAETYGQFLVLELIGGAGVAVWVTSTSALMADVTTVENRGRAIAVRTSSQRIGIIAGPAMGGLIGALFGLQSVFLFIAATKIPIIALTLWAISEQVPSRAAKQDPEAAGPRRQPDEARQPSGLRTKATIVLGLVTVIFGMISAGPGVFRTFFPLQMASAAGLSSGQTGTLISIAGLATLAIVLPVGFLLDRSGRKRLIAAGLGVSAIAIYLVAVSSNLATAAAAAVVFGVAEGISNTSIQTYAMDLAPVARRGYFLGVWQMTMNLGQVSGPLIVGLVATTASLSSALVVMSVLLIVGSLVMLVFGVETMRAHERSSPAAGS